MKKRQKQEINHFSKKDFIPSPEVVLDKISNDSALGVNFIVIHGSYIYKKVFLMATYRDTRVFDSKGNLVKSRFKMVIQPPDVDVLLCVKNQSEFLDNFSSYIQRFSLLNLPYYLTLNVIETNVFRREVSKSTPVALKTILTFRPLKIFGNLSLFESFFDIASSKTTKTDLEFQDQYDARKQLYQQKIQEKVLEFSLSRKEYQDQYPLLLLSYENKLDAAFPSDRKKLVYPESMKLKRKLIQGEQFIELK